MIVAKTACAVRMVEGGVAVGQRGKNGGLVNSLFCSALLSLVER